jgi:hypothetical protein
MRTHRIVRGSRRMSAKRVLNEVHSLSVPLDFQHISPGLISILPRPAGYPGRLVRALAPLKFMVEPNPIHAVTQVMAEDRVFF